MKYSVRYFPEKRKGVTANVPVTLSVTFSNQRMLYYTGLRCQIDLDRYQWDATAGLLRRNQITPDGLSSQKFNDELGKITGNVGELFAAYEVEKIQPTVEMLRNDLKRKLGKAIKAFQQEDFYSRFDLYIIGSGLSDNRKSTLQLVIKKLKSFNPDMTFNNIDLPAFKAYLSEKISQNSISCYLSAFKTFLKHSLKVKFISVNPFDSFEYAAETYGDPIYLTIAERDLLFNATIEDPILSQIRDIFCLQSFIGCRYGDLMRFTQSNINNGVLSYIAAKTKNEGERIAKVPLSGKAKQIIARYSLPDGRLLPMVKTGRCDHYIKKVFLLVGLTRTVATIDKKTLLEKHVTIDTLASTHMARRIFVGGLFNAGVNNEVIGSMSGHVAHSKAISRYYKVSDEQQLAAMKLIE
jgi:site-specific recombinase XerD